MSQLISRTFTSREGLTIHALVSESSEAETLLCISGFGCSHYNFIELAKDLGESYNLVLLDNRGMGKSSDVPHEYELSDVASDALEVMDLLGIRDFHLAGISMGGFISQLIALKEPKRVKTLSLLCTTSGGEAFIPLPPLTEAGLIQFYSLNEPRRTELAVEATVHPSLKEDNFGRFQSICELRRSHPVRVEQVLKQKRAVDKFLAQAIDLSQIKCPTFILSGSDDRFVSPKNSIALNELISSSKLFFVENSDHLFFLERPRRVAEILKKCLSEQDTSIPTHIGASV